MIVETSAETESIHYECGQPWDKHGWLPSPTTKTGFERVCPDDERMGDAFVDDAGAKPFEARYPGRCAQGDRIEQGDGVWYVDGKLQHIECPDTEEAVALTSLVRPTCSRCFLELPVSGVCGTCD